jgi:hypothetical protein
MIARAVVLLALGMSPAFAQVSLDAPATAKAGATISVSITGKTSERDFVSIVPKGAREGDYDVYVYAPKSGPAKIATPAVAGEYEIRLLGAASPYPTLARSALRIEAVTATLDAPAQVAAGQPFEIRWTGPNNARDYIAIGDVEPKGRKYISYQYTSNGSPVKLNAPDEAKEYELRYILAVRDTIIGRKRITVGAVSASVVAPEKVAAGAKFSVTWKGPNNPRDFITIVKAGTAPKQYGPYEYTSKGSPLQLTAPDVAGEYEVRYLTAQSYATLGTAKLTVGAATASIQAPAEAVAGTSFPVSWKGPGNAHDYLTIVGKGAREGEFGHYAYTARGNPLNMLAPVAPGEYELRYSTGQSHVTLARAPIRIAPGKQEPGLVSVTAASAMAPGGAVEIILDASGSMLQRIGKERRIDIARQTLTRLTSSVIPAGTPFAFRVFGREEDSCQTDLDIPLGPLNAAAVGARLASLEAKNGARTPIGASLAQVTSDLSAVKGERLVVLLTDGEETCGGDPAAEIEKLKKAGVAVRVNIVGFAIDDAKLAATFRHWADTGEGNYFDAKDAAGLNAALAQAMRPGFEVLTAQGQAVAEGLAGGEPVRVMPGAYSVRLKGQKSAPKPVTVRAKETATVGF